MFDSLIEQVPLRYFDVCFAASSERRVQIEVSNANVLAMQKKMLILVEQVAENV